MPKIIPLVEHEDDSAGNLHSQNSFMWGTLYWKVYVCQELDVCSLRWSLEALSIVRRGRKVRIGLRIGIFWQWLWRKLRITHSGKVRSWVHLKCLKWCCIETRMFIIEHLNLSGRFPFGKWGCWQDTFSSEWSLQHFDSQWWVKGISPPARIRSY